MQSNTLREALTQAGMAVDVALFDVQRARVIEAGKFLKRDLESTYKNFFKLIVSKILGSVENSGSASTPAFLTGFMGTAGAWAGLTVKWETVKDRMQGEQQDYGLHFYSGISGIVGQRKGPKIGRSGKSKAKAGGIARVRRARSKPFEDFIEGLTSQSTLPARIFGLVEVDFEFTQDGKTDSNISLVETKTGTKARDTKTGRFTSFPRQYTVRANAKVFNALQHLDFTEKAVVEHIIEVNGNDKQWVKVIGRRSGSLHGWWVQARRRAGR